MCNGSRGRRSVHEATTRLSAGMAPTSSRAVSAVWAWSSLAGWSTAAPGVSFSTVEPIPQMSSEASLADLEGRAEIVVVRGDIASPGVAERLVAAAEETGLPLRGVVHAAAVIDDGLVADLSRESLQRVWAPKAAGALRLHEATADRQLDWWVGFSSVASLLGSPGQAAYACANAWLDALVAWRKASGLPATAINWGQWSDVGIGRSVPLGVLDPSVRPKASRRWNRCWPATSLG